MLSRYHTFPCTFFETKPNHHFCFKLARNLYLKVKNDLVPANHRLVKARTHKDSLPCSALSKKESSSQFILQQNAKSIGYALKVIHW